jgi:hypothetical protein
MQQFSLRTIRPVENRSPYFTETIDSIDPKKSLDSSTDRGYLLSVTNNPISEAARLLGSISTPKKARSSRQNGKLGAKFGKLGGRPKTKKKKAVKAT